MNDNNIDKINEIKKKIEEENKKNDEDKDVEKIRNLTQKLMLGSMGLTPGHMFGNQNGLKF